MKRKVLVLAIVIMMAILIPQSAKADNYCYIDEKIQNIVVVQHIVDVVNSANDIDVNGDAYRNKYVIDSNWKNGVDLKQVTDVYDSNGKIVMKIYELEDLNGNDCGYILLSTVQNFCPIISYSEEGTCFYHEAISIINKRYNDNVDGKPIIVKVIDDIVCYYIMGDNYCYDITSANIKQIQKETFKKISEKPIYEYDYSEEWGLLIEAAMRGHTPITSGTQFPITDPTVYENGYDSSTSDYCSNMGTNYFKGTSFDNYLLLNGPCGHISATNITMYWRRREPTYCASLANASYGVSYYAPVYSRYYQLMNGDGPVLMTIVKYALQQYFREKGITKATATLDAYPQFETDFKVEINAGRPVSLALTEHLYNSYDGHIVTVFGYKRFKYGSTYHNYLRYADGFSTSPSRYDYALINNARYGSSIVKLRIK